MENFFEAKQDIFNVFKIEDDQMKHYIYLSLAMLEKE
jgi:hypothetical protein